ncbi:MAG: DNA polymerase III subunit gamma/tau [Isosphaeraceae bacterium]
MARTKATDEHPVNGDGSPRADSGSYTVVARRYRPQRFEDVVGQDHVVQALRNAINLNRVTHAYLFSGTRGVGKTSMARIFAKALNCVNGPTDDPCQVCDICQSIAVGQDVDVIEIDGASNNGVEAVRELRQNAGLRPSRARFKIYYIDEVHMLSTGAFNALLKTLEEPPEHVKFFFATTEPNKIPITVLSRCQRYDFAGITPEAIVETLREICVKEAIEADDDALRTVARRATGSMRDAQSLLEQLLSSGDRRLTAERVHQLLGTAPDDRVLDLIEALAAHDPGQTLTLLDSAVNSGVQPVDLLGGVLEFLRDAMVLKAGADVTLLAAAGQGARARLAKVVDAWPLDSILAAQQILAEARGRLRGSPHGRLLVELALCRAARLDDLAELSEVVGRLSALESGGPVVKKKLAPAEPEPPRPAPAPASSVSIPNSAAPRSFDLDAVQASWSEICAEVGTGIGSYLSRLQPIAIVGTDLLAIGVPGSYNWAADACEKDEARNRIEVALRSRFGRALTIRFDREEAPAQQRSAEPVRDDDLATDPLILKAVQLFEARRVHVEVEDEKVRR